MWQTGKKVEHWEACHFKGQSGKRWSGNPGVSSPLPQNSKWQTDSNSHTTYLLGWTLPLGVPDLQSVHSDKENFLEFHKWCHVTRVPFLLLRVWNLLLLGNVCWPFSRSMLTGQLEPMLDPAGGPGFCLSHTEGHGDRTWSRWVPCNLDYFFPPFIEVKYT